MKLLNRIPIRNRDSIAITIVVEPWANEVRLKPGEECELWLTGSERWPKFILETGEHGLTIWAEEGADDYQIWRDGKREV